MEIVGKFTAERLDNGQVVEGNLIYIERKSFAYILTEENLNQIVVDEDGNCRCTLIRVMEKSIKKVFV